MNLNYLKSFFQIVVDQSFVKAAINLSVSQPAISTSIKKLEKELQTKLLERSNRGIVLTEKGEILFKHCKVIFSTVEKIHSDFSVQGEKIVGKMKIGTTDEIAGYLLTRNFVDIKEQFPGTFSHIYTARASILIQKLKEGELDLLVLFYTPALPEGISEQLIDKVEFKAVVHSAKSHDKIVMNRIIGDTTFQKSHKKKFEGYKKHMEHHKDCELFLSTNNINMQLQLVLQGEGVSFLPSFVVDPLIASGKLKVLYPRTKNYYPIKILMRNSFVPSKSYKRFIDLMLSRD